MTNHVHRAPRVPGETETVLEVTIPKSQALVFAVDDRGLFWVQDGRLMRKPLGESSRALAPEQGGLGGPCFGDFSCRGGLSCVDTVCQNP